VAGSDLQDTSGSTEYLWASCQGQLFVEAAVKRQPTAKMKTRTAMKKETTEPIPTAAIVQEVEPHGQDHGRDRLVDRNEPLTSTTTLRASQRPAALTRTCQSKSDRDDVRVGQDEPNHQTLSLFDTSTALQFSHVRRVVEGKSFMSRIIVENQTCRVKMTNSMFGTSPIPLGMFTTAQLGGM